MAITSIRMEHHQSGETPLESTHETLGEDAMVQLIEPKNTCRSDRTRCSFEKPIKSQVSIL